MENPKNIEDLCLWELANKIESVAYKLDSVGNVVELVASSIVNEPESGAAWAVREMIEKYVDDLERISGDLMAVHRDSLIQNAPKPQAKKKGKKK
jgi:hypothetical protein